MYLSQSAPIFVLIVILVGADGCAGLIWFLGPLMFRWALLIYIRVTLK